MFRFLVSFRSSLSINAASSRYLQQKTLRTLFSTSLRRTSLPPNCILSPSVKNALAKSYPVVALESAIITHGMPYPFNFQTALSVESIIREEGALPATIGIIDGKIHVGLSEDQISFLSQCKKNSFKVSRRDFPFVLAKNYHGGTTVSGTMLVSHLVGIPLFVTGGIGGVHRGGEKTLDVSADLTELGKTPVTVVSAGVKSILDIGRTLEYLETQGVCVASFGESKAFPDFFTKDSGFEAPYNVKDCSEAAQMMLKRSEMNFDSGMLIAVPIPVHEEADGLIIQKAIDEALSEADEEVRGRDVTPFVLRRVSEITDGRSLWTNIALVKNNARHGARIAVEYNKLMNPQRTSSEKQLQDSGDSQPVVVGGSIADTIVKIEEKQIDFNGRSHRGKLTRNFGGVGRNMADALTRLGVRPLFVSAVGEDSMGRDLLSHNPDMDRRGILQSDDAATASYSVLLDQRGEALLGVGDMDVHEAISPSWVEKFQEQIERAPLVVIDGNISAPTMQTVCERCERNNIPIWFEPTDMNKASKPWSLPSPVVPAFASPNLGEFNAIIKYLSQGDFEEIFLNGNHKEEIMGRILSACKTYLGSMLGLMVTLGQRGFMIVRWSRSGEEDLPLLPLNNRHPSSNTNEEKMVGLFFHVQPSANIKSVSGAGDCLASGFITGMLRHKAVSECAFIGLSSANLSLKASEAVPKSLNSFPSGSAKKHPYLLIQ